MSPLDKDSMSEKIFLKALSGQTLPRPPIWLMRQAGRYLDDYRAVRDKAGSFLNLCYSPEMACEVTLQPIEKFGFDASILFADILVVPDALGQKVRFETGEGPRLDPISTNEGIKQLDLGLVDEKYDSVAKTVSLIRSRLPQETALIGFCGAPWTVATYMVAGKGTPNQAPARSMAYLNPELFQELIDILVETSIDYLSRQVDAGADALQIFDSWAGSLPQSEFQRWVIEPTKKMVSALRQKYPEVPIIGFPRGAGPLYETYVSEVGVQGVSVDETMPLDWVKTHLQPNVTVQGNLDALALIAGGKVLEEHVERILQAWSGGPFIFNLGHGIQPHTPVAHVEALIKLVRGV